MGTIGKKALRLTLPLLAVASTVGAQTTGRLSRVIPDLFGPGGLSVDSLAPLPSGETHSGHFNSAFQSQFHQINIALASQVASVPIPSPAAGFTYSYDAKTGAFVRTTDSFGPIFAERAETIGRHKYSFGMSWQHFDFDTIEGIDLDAVPAVFTHDNQAPGGRADVVATRNHIRARVEQVTAFFTAGLSDRFDLTIAVPVTRAELDVVSDATIQRIGTVDPLIHFFYEGNDLGLNRRFVSRASATGIGDVHMQVKAGLFKTEGMAVSTGLDLRIPSGDEDDLLGTGALGIRPVIAASSSHRVLSLHVNAAYQWNGHSVLAGDLDTRDKADLPDQFFYTGGVDFALNKRFTLALDLLGQVVIDTPRLLPVTFHGLDGTTRLPDISFSEGTLSETSLATGFKFNVAGKLLFNFNVTIALDEGGLRDKVVPLLGFEHSF